MPSRSFALVGTKDQWRRGRLDGALVEHDGSVGLEWTERFHAASAPPGDLPAGLAFDSHRLLYRARRGEGQVVRTAWHPLPGDDCPPLELTPLDLFRVAPAAAHGDFAPPAAEGPLRDLRGVAIDPNDRLFAAEAGSGRVLVFDLWSRALLRRVPVAPQVPEDVAALGFRVFVLLSGEERAVLELTARGRAVRFALPTELAAPARLAVSPAGELAVLEGAGTPQARVVFLAPRFDPSRRRGPQMVETGSVAVPRGTDLEFDAEGSLAVARFADEPFLRFAAGEREPRRPLRAPGYDGGGLVRTPDGYVGFWTERGLRTGFEDRVVYGGRGRVTTLRLDGGEFQRAWGRLFVEACLPHGTALRAAFHTSDEVDEEWSPGPDAEVEQPLLERERGRELPWAPPAEPEVRTYEAPITAAPGRFLWVTLELRGNSRATPRVRRLRAEHPAHDHLRRLPRHFSRTDEAASFLHRYLAIFDGFLWETEAKAALREVLLDPDAAPDEVLPWLAGFVGLLLDERWSEAAKREVIRRAAWLFRFRGTVPGLTEFLEICTGARVELIEHFRLRGMGGALLGTTGSAFTSSVLGGGFRIGGAVGVEGSAPLEGTTAQAYQRHAHRFTVFVIGSLDADRRAIAERILELHRPAHTLYDICTAERGMRVGLGLHVALSSLVGLTGGFSTLQVGGSALGRGAVLGRPDAGFRLGSTGLGSGAEFH